MDAITSPPEPRNEPVRSYAPHSAERASLEARLKELARNASLDGVRSAAATAWARHARRRRRAAPAFDGSRDDGPGDPG